MLIFLPVLYLYLDLLIFCKNCSVEPSFISSDEPQENSSYILATSSSNSSNERWLEESIAIWEEGIAELISNKMRVEAALRRDQHIASSLNLPLVLENPDITITNPIPVYTGDNPRVRYLYDLMSQKYILANLFTRPC